MPLGEKSVEHESGANNDDAVADQLAGAIGRKAAGPADGEVSERTERHGSREEHLEEGDLAQRFSDARWAGGSFVVTFLTIMFCLGLGINGALETPAMEWMRVAITALIHIAVFSGLVVLAVDEDRFPSVGVVEAVVVTRIGLVLVGMAAIVWVDGGGSVRPVALTAGLWLGAATDGALLSRVLARPDCSFFGAIRLSVLSLRCEAGDDRYRVVVGAPGVRG